jgi:hypothetical protein
VLISIADFLGIPHHPPEPGAEIILSEEKFIAAFGHLQSIGVPMRELAARKAVRMLRGSATSNKERFSSPARTLGLGGRPRSLCRDAARVCSWRVGQRRRRGR